MENLSLRLSEILNDTGAHAKIMELFQNEFGVDISDRAEVSEAETAFIEKLLNILED